MAQIFSAYKRRALDFLDLSPGLKLLDAGCGPGDDLLSLASQYGTDLELHGLDPDTRSLDTARQRANDAGTVIEFKQGTLEKLPYPDAYFDRVRADRVFQHLAEPSKALAEMRRVTRSAAGTVFRPYPVQLGELNYERKKTVLVENHQTIGLCPRKI